MFGTDSQRCHKVQRLAVIEFDLMQKHVHAGISRKITDFGGMRLARLLLNLLRSHLINHIAFYVLHRQLQ